MMAISTSSRFHNGASVGTPQVGADFNKFQTNDNPKFKVGHKIEDGDGNVYRYSHFGEDTTRGLVVSQDISESSLTLTDNSVVASASSVNTTDSLVGSKHIEFTVASVTANQYAGGRLSVLDGPGEGYTYNIVGNTATDNPASGNIRIQLKDKLQVALTTASDVAIFGNKYANLESNDATDTAAAGISCATMDVSERPYGWIQTKGTVGVLTTGVTVLGNAVSSSNILSGAVQALTTSTQKIVGRCLIVGDTTEHSVIDVKFE